MEKTKLIADRVREVFLNGTRIANTNYKDQLSDLTADQATFKVNTHNTIAALTFHVNYYIAGILNFLKGGELEIKDKYSFDMPVIKSENDWQDLRYFFLSNAEELASLIEIIPDEKLDEDFVNPKYGSYQRNFEGLIEHSYYHLGQIVLIKKNNSIRINFKCMSFVTIKKASVEGDLIVLKSLLEAEGIKCFLKNQYVTQIINYMPSFSVELQVPKDDVIRAIKILNDLETDSE